MLHSLQWDFATLYGLIFREQFSHIPPGFPDILRCGTFMSLYAVARIFNKQQDRKEDPHTVQYPVHVLYSHLNRHINNTSCNSHSSQSSSSLYCTPHWQLTCGLFIVPMLIAKWPNNLKQCDSVHGSFRVVDHLEIVCTAASCVYSSTKRVLCTALFFFWLLCFSVKTETVTLQSCSTFTIWGRGRMFTTEQETNVFNTVITNNSIRLEKYNSAY